MKWARIVVLVALVGILGIVLTTQPQRSAPPTQPAPVATAGG